MGDQRRQGVLRPLALGIGIAAIALLAVLPSAAAGSSTPDRQARFNADLTSVTGIKKYVRSLGVSTNGLVIQRGPRNYAGPNCPGPAWNCTTSTKVVQLSASAADDDDDDEVRNRFVCTRNRGGGTVGQDKTPPDQSCVIVQPGPTGTNSATCEIQTRGTAGLIDQRCLITQTGTSNTATARLVALLTGPGSEQDVVQRIEIKQNGGSGGNNLAATQTARLIVGGSSGGGDDDDDDDDNGSSGANANGANVLVKQDFHQTICTNQIATGSGRNTAAILQRGTARANHRNAGDVQVLQNTETAPTSTCLPTGPAAPYLDISAEGHDPTSCPVAGGSGTPKTAANQCARVQQDSGSGQNLIGQAQTSLVDTRVDRADVVTIAQGSLEGGIESTQDQRSGGVSRIVDVQDSDQLASVEDANVVNVTQLEDPRCCAGGHQLGNGDNRWSLGQSLTQRAKVDGVLVDPEDFEGGEAEQRGANYGNCTSAGSCTVNQTLTNNVQTETNSCTGSSCDVFTDCTATGETGFCTTEDDVEIGSTASVTSTTPDPSSANNTDSATTLVLGEAPLTLRRAFKAVQAAAQVIDTDVSATDLANAIAGQDVVVENAAFDEIPPTGAPHAVSDTSLAGFPTNGDAYAILTTGSAELADDPNSAPNSGVNLGGESVRAAPEGVGTDRDVTVLAIELDVPETANCLSFDFKFFSEEYDEFLNSQFNDAFIAELGQSTWTTNGSAIDAPDNFAFDPQGEVISVNAAGLTSMSAAQAEGTTYDGATPVLSASTPVESGVQTLYLSIFDQGDQALDSAVFVDNLVLGTVEGEEECQPGAEPAATADLAVSIEDSPDPVSTGANLVYTVVVSNAGPDTAEEVELTQTLAEGVDVVSALPGQGECISPEAVVCDLGSIEPDDSVTVIVTAVP